MVSIQLIQLLSHSKDKFVREDAVSLFYGLPLSL